MQINGTVVSVEMNVEIPKNGGGFYPGSRLTYRGQDGKISEQAFHQNVFKFNKSLEGVLKSLKAGDNIIIEKEKNDKDYWQVNSISLSNDTKQETQQPSKAGGNWETPEERAKKQLYIVRQSSLGHAVALSAANGGKKTTPEEIIEVAEKFVKYVMNGDDSIFSMTDDIPE